MTSGTSPTERFVSVAENRVFINSALGCASRCLYCYLADIGLGLTLDLASFGGNELVEFISSDPSFKEGAHGTLLSFGCFTESLDPRALPKTLEFVEATSRLGNPIQIATKRELETDVIEKLTRIQRYPSQIAAFVSLVTFSRWTTLEPGTQSPRRRLRGLKNAVRGGLTGCLYIKPFVPGITDADTKLFTDALEMNQPHAAVVGPLYANERLSTLLAMKSPVLGADDFAVPNVPIRSADSHDVSAEFRNALRTASIPVFEHSTEAMAYFRLSSTTGGR